MTIILFLFCFFPILVIVFIGFLLRNNKRAEKIYTLILFFVIIIGSLVSFFVSWLGSSYIGMRFLTTYELNIQDDFIKECNGHVKDVLPAYISQTDLSDISYYSSYHGHAFGAIESWWNFFAIRRRVIISAPCMIKEPSFGNVHYNFQGSDWVVKNYTYFNIPLGIKNIHVPQA